MSKHAFNARMQAYEAAEADRHLIPQLPICIRMDGRCFHVFTRGLARPYDPRMTQAMIETTVTLVKTSGARIGYCQSDEVTLILYNPNPRTDPVFGGRVHKLTSLYAALATAAFQERARALLPETAWPTAVFDCRVWNVPTLDEAVNVLLWREFDATKNSIAMAAQHHFSHPSLQRLTAAQMQERLHQEAGVNWANYPTAFKRGTYVLRKRVVRAYTPGDLDALPPKHTARTKPGLIPVVARWVVAPQELPPLSSIANRVEVLFEGAPPQIRDGVVV